MPDRPSNARRSDHAERNAALSGQWKQLSRAATFVALLTSPALYAVLVTQSDMAPGWAVLVTILAVAAFRGLIDILAHKLLPRASLYGADRESMLDDATARRRLWFWRGKYKLALWIGLLLGAVSLIFGTSPAKLWDGLSGLFENPQILLLALQLPLFFFFNFFILF